MSGNQKGRSTMLTRWYELTCDNCGWTINRYIDIKRSKEMLDEDGVIVVGNRHFCSHDCYEEWLRNNKTPRIKEL